MITKHIPNTITALNLISGCVAIVLALNGYVEEAATCVFLAAVFDFLDGMAARLLHAPSLIGKELDSLADVVSFGVAPAAILYHQWIVLAEHTGHSPVWAWFALLLPVASALRLAKFNIDDRQTHGFLGLPTPANALFWAFGMAFSFQPVLIAGFHPAFLLPVVALFSWLMLVELPMFSLKFTSLKWNDNKQTYLFLIGSLVLLLLLGLKGLAACVVLYLLLSLSTRQIGKKR